MKKQTGWLVATLFAMPILAQASCESVKADISQKIIQNGVPESGFTLDIVANDQVDQAGGQVVGHCENDSQKIVYKKISRDDESSVPASAGSSQDAPAQ
ncbi:MAG: DUF1161 domain-containing protein [Enterobacterales bacterium endosymbiont of Blomia tropicalis]|uniref:DUF1161 domain-containing protein n=1 Tax=Mixta mediterraneensis TaxID=2758443 RepID=UPI001873AD06|nr:DUF1161 domain-containing protein [Mixta mediterraneensis]MBE5251635.1 DUF1161 domain-containing protein [Mixta mediterraneensis]MDL4912497.1 DUF1161 domain-containing protein [Mixta mediterraneensis]